jgi:hypothetical protein
LDGVPLPISPVLVLEETEIDGYVEEKLMVHWKKNWELFCLNDCNTLQKLEAQDKVISFIIQEL